MRSRLVPPLAGIPPAAAAAAVAAAVVAAAVVAAAVVAAAAEECAGKVLAARTFRPGPDFLFLSFSLSLSLSLILFLFFSFWFVCFLCWFSLLRGGILKMIRRDSLGFSVGFIRRNQQHGRNFSRSSAELSNPPSISNPLN